MSFLRRRFCRTLLFGATLILLIVKVPNALLVQYSPSAPATSGGVKSHPQYFHPIDINVTLKSPPTRTVVVLGKHRYRPDGLLEVNENGAHPLYELITRAEKEWDEKLSRASTTFRQVVKEYKRRYNRLPPKGFDLWWTYVEKHNVQLPDEYDTIFEDLEPFWGMSPSDLLKIQEESETNKDSYTIGKNDSVPEVDVLTYAFQEGRYDQLIAGSREIIKMFRQIQDYLPPFRMTFSPHDGPNRHTDYGVKQALLEAAAGETYIARAALPKVDAPGWTKACSPKSLARRKTINLDSPPPRPKKKTFIYDHVKSMDPCDHPDHFFHHSQFLSHNMGPWPQHAMVPQLSYCSTFLHHDIRFPVPYGWMEDIYPRTDDPEWEDRLDERLLWRGSSTGMFRTSTSRWRHAQRDFLVTFANDFLGTLEVLPPNRTKTERIGELKELRKANINAAVMDVAFSGKPIACSESTCQLMNQIYPWRQMMTFGQAGDYKYVVDVDGNGWSGRFKRLITSNALVFKSTIYPEWFANRVQPWVHYVPIQLDLSDLHDALLFFRGDGNGEGAHDNLARKIAISGREWSKKFWRKEDMIAYLFRLTLEYARLMNTDRESMTFMDAKDW